MKLRSTITHGGIKYGLPTSYHIRTRAYSSTSQFRVYSKGNRSTNEKTHSTMARELSRNNNANYSCETAQEVYFSRSSQASKPKGKCCPTLVADIEKALKATWSPEKLSNTVTKGKLSFKTIYRWLYSGMITKGNVIVLRHKGKPHKPTEKRGKFIIGKSIHLRPKEVKCRQTSGHWELDTVVSSRGKSKGYFATFVERKTRLYTAIKIANKRLPLLNEQLSNYMQFFLKTPL